MLKGYEWESEFAKSHRAEGRAEGLVEGLLLGLLLLLESRGFVVTDGVRERVEGCTDPDQLARWVRRVAHADTVDDVFV